MSWFILLHYLLLVIGINVLAWICGVYAKTEDPRDRSSFFSQSLLYALILELVMQSLNHVFL